MKLATLKGGVRQLPVVFKGENGEPDETLNIEYRPGELTIGTAEDMYEAIAKGNSAIVGSILLEKILVSWDLMDDEVDENGEPTGRTVPVPVSEKGFRKVPLPALGIILQAMTEEMVPTPQKSEDSDELSRPEEPQARSLSGTS